MGQPRPRAAQGQLHAGADQPEHPLGLLPHQRGQSRHRRQPADLGRRARPSTRSTARPGESSGGSAARRATSARPGRAVQRPAQRPAGGRTRTRSGSSTTATAAGRPPEPVAGDRRQVDTKAKTATLVSSVQHPDGLIGAVPGQRPAAARRPPVRRLGTARSLLGVRLRRQPALRRPGAGRLRHLPRLPLALGRQPPTAPTVVADKAGPTRSASTRSGTAPPRSTAGSSFPAVTRGRCPRSASVAGTGSNHDLSPHRATYVEVVALDARAGRSAAHGCRVSD